VTGPSRAQPPASTGDVTASEIACFAYCAKAWHLQYVLGAPVRETVARRRKQGVAEHDRHAGRVYLLGRLGQRRWSLVVLFLVIAAAAVMAALAIS
jgi:hypothetical protein